MESSTGLKPTSTTTLKLYFSSGLRVRQIPNRLHLGQLSVTSYTTRLKPFSRPSSRLYSSTLDNTQLDANDQLIQESWKDVFQFDLTNLKGDVFGGFTAAVVALPLALAFGVASGAGPIAGLYGAIFSGFFAALFGGTPAQVTGPTGPMTVIAATLFTQFAFAPNLAYAVICLSGIFQVVMGAMKLGRFIKLVPAPVISGFMSGIGCIILSTQLLPLCGLHAAPNALTAVQSLPNVLPQMNIHAFFIGVLSFCLCTFTPQRITKIIPGSFFALILCTIISNLAGLNIPILGSIPSQLPVPLSLQFPLNHLLMMTKAAFILALLGTIDSLLTSLVADNLTETYHDSNQEMIGQGIGNAITGIFGGIPGAGATMRTVVNIRSGGKTRLSGMFHSFLLFMIIMGAGKIAQSIPHAVLSGILMKTGYDIIDKRFISKVPKLPLATGIVMWTVLLTTVFVDLIVAVAAGSILASILLVNKMSNIEIQNCTLYTADSFKTSTHTSSTSNSQSESSSISTNEKGFSDLEVSLLKASSDYLGVIQLRGSFTFSSANQISRKVSTALNEIKGGVVMDLTEVSILDGDAILAIERLLIKAKIQEKLFLITGASQEMAQLMDKNEMKVSLDPKTERPQVLSYAMQELCPEAFAEMNNTVTLQMHDSETKSQQTPPSSIPPTNPSSLSNDDQPEKS